MFSYSPDIYNEERFWKNTRHLLFLTQVHCYHFLSRQERLEPIVYTQRHLPPCPWHRLDKSHFTRTSNALEVQERKEGTHYQFDAIELISYKSKRPEFLLKYVVYKTPWKEEIELLSCMRKSGWKVVRKEWFITLNSWMLRYKMEKG